MPQKSKLLKYIADNKLDYEYDPGEYLWFGVMVKDEESKASGVRHYHIDLENGSVHCEYNNTEIEIAGLIPFDIIHMISEDVKNGSL